MQAKVYQLQIYQQSNLIFYNDMHHQDHNYQVLRSKHRIQLCYGVSESILAFIKQIHPDKKTQMKSFRTKEYQYNILDTINGVRFILLTSLISQKQIDNTLNDIYDAYLTYVKKNYMYKHGDIIRINKFTSQVVKILSKLTQS